jgi:hypothetical protein
LALHYCFMLARATATKAWLQSFRQFDTDVEQSAWTLHRKAW